MMAEQERPAMLNPGELLRAERERVGFSAEEVASHLNLSRTTLAYLEQGRFERLPGDIFSRGYIRSYARLLKLDPGPLMHHYDRYVGVEQREPRVTSINQVEKPPRRAARWGLLLSTLLIVAIMLALGLWWWSGSRVAGPSPAEDQVEALIDNVQVDAMALPESFSRLPVDLLQEQEAETPMADAEPGPDAGLQRVQAPLSGVSEPEPEPAAVVSAVEPQPDAAVSGQAVGLVMKFTANCWVQVSVPGGEVVHSAQMGPEQTLTIARQGPLDLVIGAADAVASIEFNGQPVALTANRQSGVARLRVGQ